MSFRSVRAAFGLGAALLLSVGGCARAQEQPLPPGVKAGPWTDLLGDGASKHWRGYRLDTLPQAWSHDPATGVLTRTRFGGDIVTRQQFTDFEFVIEWKVGPGGNNGIKYLVSEARPSTPGPEYQMIDDAMIPDALHQTASFYEVLAPRVKTPARPPGDWNQSRLVISGNHVEHWLNGVMVLDYELGSAEVKAGVAKSKFKNVRGFDEKIRGHILLTNHNRETWFRNIRLRELPVK